MNPTSKQIFKKYSLRIVVILRITLFLLICDRFDFLIFYATRQLHSMPVRSSRMLRNYKFKHLDKQCFFDKWQTCLFVRDATKKVNILFWWNLEFVNTNFHWKKEKKKRYQQSRQSIKYIDSNYRFQPENRHFSVR